MHRVTTIATLLFFSVGFIQDAFAFDESGYLAKGAEVNLSIENYQQTLQNSSTKTESTIRTQRLKLTAYEPGYRWLQGGLHIGYLNATHDDELLATGTIPSGQFVGIQLRKPKNSESRYNLHWSLSYSYNRLEGNEATTASKLTWHDTHAELGFIIDFSLFQLSSGLYYARLDGTEQSTIKINSSPTSRNQQFNNDNNSGSYAALGYKTSKKGRVELKIRNGTQRGVALFFTQQF